MNSPLLEMASSSDSELSDSWGIVDPVVPSHLSGECNNVSSAEASINPLRTSQSEETSDAESIEVIQDDSTDIVHEKAHSDFTRVSIQNGNGIIESEDELPVKDVAPLHCNCCLRILLNQRLKSIFLFCMLIIIFIFSCLLCELTLVYHEGSVKDNSEYEVAYLEKISFLQNENHKLTGEIEELRNELAKRTIQPMPEHFNEDLKEWDIALEVISQSPKDIKSYYNGNKSLPNIQFKQDSQSNYNKGPDTTFNESQYSVHFQKVDELIHILTAIASLKNSDSRTLRSLNSIANSLRYIKSFDFLSYNKKVKELDCYKGILNFVLSRIYANSVKDLSNVVNNLSKTVLFHKERLMLMFSTRSLHFRCCNCRIRKTIKNYYNYTNRSKYFSELDKKLFKNYLKKDQLKKSHKHSKNMLYGNFEDKYAIKKDSSFQLKSLKKKNIAKNRSLSKATDSKLNNYSCHGVRSNCYDNDDTKNNSSRKSKAYTVKWKSLLSHKHNMGHNDGTWYLDIGEQRSTKRGSNHKSDWVFDRSRARSTYRNKAKYFFDRAEMREFYRQNS